MSGREESSILQLWKFSTTLCLLATWRFIKGNSGYCGTKVCGLCWISATATAVTERLSEALRNNNVEVLWRRQIKMWMSSMSTRVYGFFYGGLLSTIQFESLVSLVVFRTLV